jgi:CheY-like chemotaxis protein
MIYCLVTDKNISTRNSLCYILLSLGIKGIPVSNYEEAISKLNKYIDIGAIIVDVDNKDIDGIKLIYALRHKYAGKQICIIINTINTSRKFVTELIDLGINGYLLKPFSIEKATKSLKNIFSSYNPYMKEKRQHIRIQPDPDELLRLYFRMPYYSKLISGKIRNLSMGGVATELYSSPPSKILKPNTHIPEIVFSINTKQLTPSGIVTIYEGRILAIRFQALSLSDKFALARYIFNKIVVE